MALKGRERKKRTYTKVNEEYWSKGKGDLTKRVKKYVPAPEGRHRKIYR
jgi:hypothetical protein